MRLELEHLRFATKIARVGVDRLPASLSALVLPVLAIGPRLRAISLPTLLILRYGCRPPGELEERSEVLAEDGVVYGAGHCRGCRTAITSPSVANASAETTSGPEGPEPVIARDLYATKSR